MLGIKKLLETTESTVQVCVSVNCPKFQIHKQYEFMFVYLLLCFQLHMYGSNESCLINLPCASADTADI